MQSPGFESKAHVHTHTHRRGRERGREEGEKEGGNRERGKGSMFWGGLRKGCGGNKVFRNIKYISKKWKI